jgi:initiation factor 1A
MPPNKGGKGYRKGKHGETDDAKLFDWDAKDGQMLARVLKKLGDRRFRVYCNDNRERLCKLAGSMRKSEWVSEGAVVLISIRDITNASAGASAGTGSEKLEIGDILMLVDTRIYGKLKKVHGVNPILFGNLEQQDESQRKKKADAVASGNMEEGDDIFSRGSGDEGEDEEEDEEENEAIDDSPETQVAQALARENAVKLRDKALAAKRSVKEEDLDIDAI